MSTERRESDHKVVALVPIPLKVPPEEIRIDQEQHVGVKINDPLDVIQDFMKESFDKTAVAGIMLGGDAGPMSSITD